MRHDRPVGERMEDGFAARGALVALATLLLTTACTGSDAPGPALPPAATAAPAPTQSAPPSSLDPNVAATIDEVLTAAEHPGLTWKAIPDVVPALKALYDVEPDRLFWFDGDKPLTA